MKPELELKEVDINSIIDEIRKLKWESFDKDSPLKVLNTAQPHSK